VLHVGISWEQSRLLYVNSNAKGNHLRGAAVFEVLRACCCSPTHLKDMAPAVFTNVTLHLILVNYLQRLLPVPAQQQTHPATE
jgi:hypothetical protein